MAMKSVATPIAIKTAISAPHNSITGIFPFPTVDWGETAVMQIEPDTKGTQ